MAINPWTPFRRFLFQVDPETAHHVTSLLIKSLGHTAPSTLRFISGSPNPQSVAPRTTLWNLPFLNSVGLAAGFDKNAELLEALPHLGFGFAEIGTVTPLAQAGHSRPRLFRDVEQKALFNRMGFNNLGAEIVSKRVLEAKPGLPKHFRVGVNIGKNATTPLEEASKDYKKAVSPFQGLVDYVVVNVSSPNTSGLRSLQMAESLRPILQEVLEEVSKWEKPPPVLVKWAPELDLDALKPGVELAESLKLGGIVLTNTLGGTFSAPNSPPTPGGWSGSPLKLISRQRLAEVRSLTALPIVSVGGIDSEEEALKRFELGASLIQIYSSWIFNGPRFPSKIANLSH